MPDIQCNKCGEIKHSSHFSGKSLVCKPCIVIRNREYYRTEKGFITNAFNSCKRNSAARGHVPPNFTKEELGNWLRKANLVQMLADWQQANWNPHLKPSIDRFDSNLPYTFDNMRLLTWAQNNAEAYEERKTRRSTKQSVKVVQYTLTGEFVASYISIAQAARDNNFCRTYINSCVNGKYPNAHGYLWRKE